MYVRYNEPGLVTGAELSRFGEPGNFYSKKSTLKSILEALHRKYGEEPGRRSYVVKAEIQEGFPRA